MRLKLSLALAGYALALSACAIGGGYDGPVRAPEPVKPIDAARFYSGRWHEIARLPEKITDGCVAGTTDFKLVSPTKIDDRDACREGTPAGKEKVFTGPGTILDPGRNTKVEISYRVFELLRVKRTYWFLDHADDYSWMISADPSFEKLWIFTRDPQISAAQRAALVERARGFGYDVSKLEFPAQPSR